MTRSMPFYLDAGVGPVFALLDDPGPEWRGRTAVVLCPPFGWEDISSYRSRRAWAAALADAGHPTLRIDLPGCGDSAGAPRDPRRLEAWTDAVGAAVAWLRAGTSCPTVAVAGIGLGGLVACHAAARGAAIDELVLWAVPARGRKLVRELRALQRMEIARMRGAGAPEPPPAPPGFVEAGGFVLTAETTAALEALDVTELELGGVRRALLLGRDGVAPDDRLRAHLEECGADVTVAAGHGYGHMMAGPQDARIPRGTLASSVAWIARGGERSGADAVPAPTAEALHAVELAVGSGRVREQPLEVERPGGRLFGILTEPIDMPAAPICAVLLNSGAIRHVGQNRMWVEAARRWAARGVPTLRLDLEGIGDSDGDGERYADVDEFYVPGLYDQVQAALNALERRLEPCRFVAAGLCAGAYWAFESARRDPRVAAALLVNTGALVWNPDLVVQRDARRTTKLLLMSSWRRILRGQVSRSLMLASLRALATLAARAPGRLLKRRHGDSGAVDDPLAAALDELREADKRIVLAFCDGEPMEEELVRDGYVECLERWPNVRLERFPGRDHTMRPTWMQAHAHELLDRALDGELRRSRVRPPETAAGGSAGLRPGL